MKNKRSSRLKIWRNKPLLKRIALIVVASIVVILLVFSGLRLRGGSLREVWLPQNNLQTWPDGRISLFESSHTVRSWRYGKGTMFTTTNGYGGVVYEAPSGQIGLDPSHCPNVFNEKEVIVPSGCNKSGTINGADVYSIDRSLPMGTTDVYVELGNTFIASTSGGSDDAQTLQYFRTFNRYAPDQAQQFLAANKKLATQHNGIVQITEDKEKALEARAYNILPFTPVLPANIPSDWEVTGKTTIYGDGRPPTPRFLSINYRSKKSSQQFISIDIGKLSDFQLSTTCGPTIGAGARHLQCQQIPGTNYYERWDIDGDYATHYIYEPIGDALALISAGNCCSNTVHTVSQEQLSVQTAIAKALQPVSKSVFIDATYDPDANTFFAEASN